MIKEGVRKCNFIGPLAREGFGLSTANDIVSINARILDPPRVLPVNFKNFFEVATVKKWTAVSFFKKFSKEKLESFCKKLIGVCIKKGMKFCELPVIPVSCRANEDIETVLKDVHKNAHGLELLVVILPGNPGSYGRIKTVCETEVGII
ncbi:Protein argonaute 5 [Cardamine amara subsp. amara]|uniref:Protein argonaute 5 n=1 Tax=Cardamine amara subsp. amara TaxID=228776 RepID=A0ABD1AX21_CARAN